MSKSKGNKEQSKSGLIRHAWRERKFPNGKKSKELVSYKGVKVETICWNCVKAAGGYDCPWANKLVARTDWKATRNDMMVSHTTEINGKKTYRKELTESYIVNECPGYEEKKS